MIGRLVAGLTLVGASLALMACGDADLKAQDSHGAAEQSSARTALALASSDAFIKKPVDTEALAKMPGIDQALSDQAIQARGPVLAKMKDPSSPIWGETWTVNYTQICGTVNAKNSFGAYAGPARYIVFSGNLAVIEGSADFHESDWVGCQGVKRVISVAP